MLLAKADILIRLIKKAMRLVMRQSVLEKE
jgi:hypothetical protein